jgi:LPXTG-motif cell wall-anchored protein
VATSLPECTTAGTGVTINSFSAQAYGAAGNPISAGSSGNDDWIIAVVIIILILLLLFFFMRRRRKTSPAAAAVQATSTAPSIPLASTGRFCRSCGSPVESGASFCPGCGKVL